MIVKKLVNNNVLIASDGKNGEVVLMGSGLAFKGKVGQKVDESRIEKTFVLKNDSRLSELLEDIPLEYLGVCEEIVNYAVTKHHMTIDDSIYLGLTDHIYFAVSRIKDGFNIDNPFQLEIENFFPEDWDVGKYGQKKLYEKFGVKVPDSEAGYIAMHIIECHYNLSRRNMNEGLVLVNELVGIITSNYPLPENTNGLSYKRMLTHVRYFVQRYLSNSENKKDDQMLDSVYMQLFAEEHNCVSMISEYLKRHYGREMSASEMSYMILHLRNCRNFK